MYPLTNILAVMATAVKVKQMIDVRIRYFSWELGEAKFDCCPWGGLRDGIMLGSIMFDMSLVKEAISRTAQHWPDMKERRQDEKHLAGKETWQ